MSDTVLGETMIAKAEEDLGITYLNAESADMALSSINSSGKIYQHELEELYLKLNLDSTLIIQALNFFPFKKEGNYTVQCEKHLRTLFILLGKGEKDLKLRLLFRLYARESKSSITTNELTEMIQNLLLISLVCIPDFALSKYGKRVNLNPIVNILNGSRHRIFKNCIDKFQFFKTMKCKFIIKLFKDEPISMLLEPNELRSYAIADYERRIQGIKNDGLNASESAMKEAASENLNTPKSVSNVEENSKNLQLSDSYQVEFPQSTKNAKEVHRKYTLSGNLEETHLKQIREAKRRLTVNPSRH
jgi:Ca2+-binding EF-hand superfamily protein